MIYVIYVPTFIITYNPLNPPLKEWLKEAFLILQSDKKMRKIYEKPPSVTFREAINLKQVLVKNRLRELPYTDCSDLPLLAALSMLMAIEAGHACSALNLMSPNSSKVHSLGSPTTSETTLFVNPPMLCTW